MPLRQGITRRAVRFLQVENADDETRRTVVPVATRTEANVGEVLWTFRIQAPKNANNPRLGKSLYEFGVGYQFTVDDLDRLDLDVLDDDLTARIEKALVNGDPSDLTARGLNVSWYKSLISDGR